jgi:hypothetical protein
LRTITVPFSFSGGSLRTTNNPHTIARQEITDVLTTDNYERVMVPMYGASTSSLLFTQVDTLVEADFKEEALHMLNANVSNCPPDGSWSGPGHAEATLYVNVSYRLAGEVGIETLSVGVLHPLALTSFSI